MIPYLENIIGIHYADNPTLFVLCTLIILWFMYQLWTFIYYVFGINK